MCLWTTACALPRSGAANAGSCRPGDTRTRSQCRRRGRCWCYCMLTVTLTCAEHYDSPPTWSSVCTLWAAISWSPTCPAPCAAASLVTCKRQQSSHHGPRGGCASMAVSMPACCVSAAACTHRQSVPTVKRAGGGGGASPPASLQWVHRLYRRHNRRCVAAGRRPWRRMWTVSLLLPCVGYCAEGIAMPTHDSICTANPTSVMPCIKQGK